MNPDESTYSKAVAATEFEDEPTWTFAIIFSAVGFVVAGCVVFEIGKRAAFPPPAPPGTGNCGNAALGGAFMMLVGAPIAATAAAIVAGVIGGLLDLIRRRFTA